MLIVPWNFFCVSLTTIKEQDIQKLGIATSFGTDNTNSSGTIESRANKFYSNPFHLKKPPSSVQVHHHGRSGPQFGHRTSYGPMPFLNKSPPGQFGPDSFAFSSLIKNHKIPSKKSQTFSQTFKPSAKPVPPPLFYGQLTPSTTTEAYKYTQSNQPYAPKPQPPPKVSSTGSLYDATGQDPIHSFSSSGRDSGGHGHSGGGGHSGSGGYGHSGGGDDHHSGGGGYGHSGGGDHHSGGGGYGHSGGGHSGSGHSGSGGYGHSGSGGAHSGSGHSGGGGYGGDHHSGGGGDHGKCYDCHKDPGYKPTRKPGPYGYASPNFKCEYEKETLYVTKTEYKFKKKCFTVFSTSCRKEHATGKGIGFKKVCNEFSVTRYD